MAPREESLKRGANLGRYEIRELIGLGGMGCVYRALDTVLRWVVAVMSLYSSALGGEVL